VSDHLGVSNDGDVGSLSLDLSQTRITNKKQEGRKGQLSALSFARSRASNKDIRTLAFPMGLEDGDQSKVCQLELEKMIMRRGLLTERTGEGEEGREEQERSASLEG